MVHSYFKRLAWGITVSVFSSSLFFALSCKDPPTDSPPAEIYVPEDQKCSTMPDTLCLLILPTKDALDNTLKDGTLNPDNRELELWHRLQFDNQPIIGNTDISDEDKYARIAMFIRDRIEEDIDTALLNSGLEDLYFEVTIASIHWDWIATNEWVKEDQDFSYEDYPTEEAIKFNSPEFYNGLFQHTNVKQIQEIVRPDIIIFLTEDYSGSEILFEDSQMNEEGDVSFIGGYLQGTWNSQSDAATLDNPQERTILLSRKIISRDFYSKGNYFFSKAFGLLMGARKDIVSEPDCDEVTPDFYGENRCAHFEGINPENPDEPHENPWRTVLADMVYTNPSYLAQCPFDCPIVNVYSGNSSNTILDYSTTTFLDVYPGESDFSNNRCIIRKSWSYVADFSETIGETDLSRLIDNPNIVSTIEQLEDCE